MTSSKSSGTKKISENRSKLILLLLLTERCENMHANSILARIKNLSRDVIFCCENLKPVSDGDRYYF